MKIENTLEVEECDPKMEGEEIHTLFFQVKKL